MKLSDKTYNTMKWIVTLVIPGTMWLLSTLNRVWDWGLPIGEIAETASSIATFLGGILGFSTALYNEEKKDDQ